MASDSSQWRLNPPLGVVVSLLSVSSPSTKVVFELPVEAAGTFMDVSFLVADPSSTQVVVGLRGNHPTRSLPPPTTAVVELPVAVSGEYVSPSAMLGENWQLIIL